MARVEDIYVTAGRCYMEFVTGEITKFSNLPFDELQIVIFGKIIEILKKYFGDKFDYTISDDQEIFLNINLKGYAKYIAIYDDVYSENDKMYEELSEKYGDIVFRGNDVYINRQKVPRDSMDEFQPYINAINRASQRYHELTNESPYKDLEIDAKVASVLEAGIKRYVERHTLKKHVLYIDLLCSIYNGLNLELCIKRKD